MFVSTNIHNTNTPHHNKNKSLQNDLALTKTIFKSIAFKSLLVSNSYNNCKETNLQVFTGMYYSHGWTQKHVTVHLQQTVLLHNQPKWLRQKPTMKQTPGMVVSPGPYTGSRAALTGCASALGMTMCMIVTVRPCRYTCSVHTNTSDSLNVVVWPWRHACHVHRSTTDGLSVPA